MTGSCSSEETDQTAPDTSPAAVSSRDRALVVLNKRADFVRASHALRQSTKGLNLQARARRPDEADGSARIRVGFTCSKKVGNAVARNRAKRRLREVARLLLPQLGLPGHDYVLVGKNGATADRPFDALQDDLRTALARIHAAPGPSAR